MNAEREKEIRERHIPDRCAAFRAISMTPCVPCELLAALDECRQRAEAAEKALRAIGCSEKSVAARLQEHLRDYPFKKWPEFGERRSRDAEEAHRWWRCSGVHIEAFVERVLAAAAGSEKA